MKRNVYTKDIQCSLLLTKQCEVSSNIWHQNELPAFLKGELFSFLQRLFQDLGVVSHSASSSFLPTSAYCLCVRTSY